MGSHDSVPAAAPVGGEPAQLEKNNWQPTEAGAHLRGRVTADTKPELALRRALHARGLRYRLNRPVGGFRPDIVFVGRRTVVFVDGCFWHGCPVHGPKGFRGPNADKWRAKIETNAERDQRAVRELSEQGWQVVRVWECDVKRDVGAVAELVESAVQDARASGSA